MIVLLLCFRGFDSSALTPKDQTPNIPTQQTVQPGVSSIRPKQSHAIEDKARKNADAVIGDTLAILQDLEKRQTPESRRRHAEQKMRRYEDLFKSWNLKPESISDALNVLEKRNQRLDDINRQMLDGKVEPHLAAKEIIESKRGAEKELSDIMGVELSVEFGVWEKPRNRKKN